jgi:tetratricopeptide (TPR) repeat protein
LVVLALGLVVLAGVVVYYVSTSGSGTAFDAALEAIKRRDFRAASEHLDRHLAEYPDDVSARLLAARTARRRGAHGQFLEHIEIYKKQKGDDNDRALEYKLYRIQQGDITHSDAILRSASADPAAIESYLSLEALIETCLAGLQPRSGQASRPPAGAADPIVGLARRGVDLWLNAQTAEADQVQGLVWRGRVRAAAGDHDGAVSDFRAALERNSEHFDARFHLAMTIGSGDPVEAASLLERLREAEPDNVMVSIALASSYRLLGRTPDARAILIGLSERGMTDAWLLNELGLTELDAGRLAEAERHLRQTLAKRPDDLVAILGMSRCMMLAGKAEDAAQFQKRYEEVRTKATGRSQASKP